MVYPSWVSKERGEGGGIDNIKKDWQSVEYGRSRSQLDNRQTVGSQIYVFGCMKGKGGPAITELPPPIRATN